MDNTNYRMPFDPRAAMTSDDNIATCSTGESIAQNGENRYDPQYGNDVWEVEFDNGVSSAAWENIFIKSLQRQIRDYEPRLTEAHVSADINYVEHSYETRNFTEVKKKVRVAINAKMRETGENFSFSTELFLSPMSID